MRKDPRVVRKASIIIGAATEAIITDLVNFHQGHLKGREEEFTSQLRYEMTMHFFDRIKSNLDKEIINGVKFEIYTFSKKEESKVGADILGLLEVSRGDSVLRKGYLAQSKVGLTKKRNKNSKQIHCSLNSHLKSQVDNMLKISAASYVFIYSEKGVSVTPALEVQQSKSTEINSKDFYQRSFSAFYEEFFKCFDGDGQLALPTNSPQDIVEFAKNSDLATHTLLVRASDNDSLFNQEQ